MNMNMPPMAPEPDLSQEPQQVAPQAQAEKGPERIPSEEEVLAIIGRFAENAVLSREPLSDEKGLYLLEARVVEKAGEFTEYSYMRKGNFGRNSSSATEIHAVFYVDDMPISSDLLATCDPETGEWRDVK